MKTNRTMREVIAKIRVLKLPHAQRATAFHFLISKRLGFLVDEGPALLEASPTGTMGTSESKVAINNSQERCFFLLRLFDAGGLNS